MIQVIDNFLPQQTFVEVQSYFMRNTNLPWFYTGAITSVDDGNWYQFVNFSYDGMKGIVDQESFNITNKILDSIYPPVQTIARIKTNMMMKTKEHYLPAMHIDFGSNLGMKTSIFYVNTTNGKTVFETGEEVECVENRLVTFDAGMFHSGYTCTDESRRIVVNLNYIPRETYADIEKNRAYRSDNKHGYEQ